jgi:hypothetical protein
MDSIENPDRSLESEIYLADSDGNNFKMILGKEKQFSNASLSHWKMLAFLSSTTSFVSVPTLAVMPINGKMISSQSLSTVTKQILRVTTTNIYTSPLKVETILNRVNIKTKK